jgi:transcriptional regulator with XRE-family HTH domain
VHAGSIKRVGATDAALGRRIRALRLAKGVPQSALAQRLGVPVQQIQRYEKGAACIGVGRLIEIATALRLPVNALLRHVEQSERSVAQDDPIARLSSGQAVQLVRAFVALRLPRNRRVRQARSR